MTQPETLSDEEIGRIDRRHVRHRPGETCRACGERWPCSAIRAITTIDDTRIELRRANQLKLAMARQADEETDRADRAEQRIRTLEEALREMSYAAGELSRSLAAWAAPVTGMGANISQESRSRRQLALREYEKAVSKARAALQTEQEGR